MNLKDYKDSSFFKRILILISLSNIALMIIGPLYFASYYFLLVIVWDGYMILRTSWFLIYTALGTYETISLIKQDTQLKAKQQLLIKQQAKCSKRSHLKETSINQTSKQSSSPQTIVNRGIDQPDKQFYHAFIIPNYNQHEAILQETLRRLALNDQSNKYLVFLAMEERQPNSRDKALKLISEFKHCFKAMHHTSHVQAPHELKGKSANYNWCIEHMEEEFLIPKGIDPDFVMLTIIDADSWVPNKYVKEINRLLKENYGSRRLLFHPPHIFTQNHERVSILNRVYDRMYAKVHFSLLYSVFNLSHGCANFSLSYRLAKDTDFWDTCPDAITDDMHTDFKVSWKTHGQVRFVSIYTPFSLACLSTNQGFIADLKARFWQAQRHSRACTQTAYLLCRLFNDKWNWRSVLFSFQFFEIYSLLLVYPWFVIGGILVKLLNENITTPSGASYPSMMLWLNIIPILIASISFALYSYASHQASKYYHDIHHLKRQHRQQNLIAKVSKSIIQVLLLFHVIYIILNLPASLVALYQSTSQNRQFRVTKKKVQ